MTLELDGKIALVTGGSRGLGRELACAFAHAGADVVIASRRLDACESLADEIRRTTGRRALPIACHVGRWSEIDHLVDMVYAEWGRVDVLINNAGMSPLFDGLTSVTEELFDKVIAVNLRGPFRLTALVGDRMVAGDGGAIVNISSVASIRPQAHDLPYAAAKAGLNTLTIGFAQALGPKVRVNGVLAGPFLTDVSKAWDVARFEAHAAAHFPLARLGQPPEIVGPVLMLVSNAGSFTTGALLTVDGGAAGASSFPEGT
ncbi:MAG TPA: SDR family oxidoreductase [Acidimicrobiales bacterium]|jgi:NAD(P)-dependent dehydrogenase (short-subunit alcohol dehydrogenase family)|nr:SDR family oxidoreductase [Acidimicrobiales bacterium]